MPLISKQTMLEQELRNLAASITLALQGSPLEEGYKISTLLSLAGKLVSHTSRNNISTYFHHAMASMGILAESLNTHFDGISVNKKREQSRLKMQRRRARLKLSAKKTAAQPKSSGRQARKKR